MLIMIEPTFIAVKLIAFKRFLLEQFTYSSFILGNLFNAHGAENRKF